MQAEKVLLETDMMGNIKCIPVLPANKKVEAIFLIIEDMKDKITIPRKPHEFISGKIQIHGDIFNSAPIENWDLPG